jgi:hypothetical protein
VVKIGIVVFWLETVLCVVTDVSEEPAAHIYRVDHFILDFKDRK